MWRTLLDLLLHLLEVGDRHHGLVADRASTGRIRAHLAQRLVDLVRRDAGLALALANLGLRLIELGDDVRGRTCIN